MKHTYFGFSQKVAIEMDLNLIDLAILRYFIDFKDSGTMVMKVIDGVPYYWVKHEAIRESNPILGINNNKTLSRRLQKLVDAGVLTKYLEKKNGTYTFYSTGPHYKKLIDDSFIRKDQGTKKSPTTGLNSPLPGDLKVPPKDSSINNSSINNIYIAFNESEIINHRRLTDKMKTKINTRLKEYSEEEIIKAIRNYGKIVNGKEYYFDHKWTLVEFLDRGLERFIDFEVAHNNFIDKKGGGLSASRSGDIQTEHKENIERAERIKRLREQSGDTGEVDF